MTTAISGDIGSTYLDSRRGRADELEADQLGSRRRRCGLEAEPLAVVHVNAVETQNVEMHVHIQARTRSMDARDGASLHAP